jgi:ribosomal protein S12 methylthiotransferase accessory factor
MNFMQFIGENSKVRLSSHVSLLPINAELFFIKYGNSLFKLSTGSEVDKQSRIFHVMQQPKKLAEILDLLTDFKEKDVLDFLETLYKNNLIEIEIDTNKNNGIKINPNKASFLGYNSVNPDIQPPQADSKLLLLGDGVLAEKLAVYFTHNRVNYKMLRSSAIIRPSSSLTYLLSSPCSLSDYDLIIVAEDYPNILLFETVNRMCINECKPWLRVSFDDRIGYLGPFVLPGNTSCYNCCELRLIANSPYYEYYLWKYREYIPKAELAVSEVFADMLSALCANEIITYLENSGKPQTLNNLYVLDTKQVDLSKHGINMHPNCTYCNWIEKQQQPKSLAYEGTETRKITRRRATSTIFGSNSSLTNDDLLQKLRGLEDEKTGNVLMTEKLFETNVLGIKSHHFFYATCSRPIRINLTQQDSTTGPCHANVTLLSNDNLIEPSPSGSGLTPAEAEISTLMESVERYSCMVIDYSRLIWSTHNNVKKTALNPIDLVLYPNECYDKKGFKFSRFSPDSNIPWIEGYELLSGKIVLVPADFVYYPAFREKPLVSETSNGAAAHTDTVQAILNGLFEVIERDAFLVMWMNRLSMPILDIQSLPFGFNESLKLINEWGMRVKLVNLTNDTNIPTVMAACYNLSRDKYPALVVGTGSHIEPELAIKKALFEMEFQLINYLQEPPKRKILSANQISASYEHPVFYLNPKMRKYWDFMIKSKKKSILPRRGYSLNEGKKESLMRIVRLLNNKNHRTIFVDVTPSDIRNLGLKVVKVLVTGLQPLYFRDRIRPNFERLCSVPSSLGYKTKRVERISQLNSAPHPLP